MGKTQVCGWRFESGKKNITVHVVLIYILIIWELNLQLYHAIKITREEIFPANI